MKYSTTMFLLLVLLSILVHESLGTPYLGLPRYLCPEGKTLTAGRCRTVCPNRQIFIRGRCRFTKTRKRMMVPLQARYKKNSLYPY
ncbi:hypothetical protein JTB14_033137 [Gonioctena quinquepunctata]|nr:hypothetical protein JTB14_033137 [Gonioctena quinquepunctata]